MPSQSPEQSVHMSNPIRLAVVAIAFGAGLAVIVVLLIAIVRWRLSFNSLSHSSMNQRHQLIGRRATVEIPCGPTQRGKVRIALDDRILEMPALTYDDSVFPGQTVLIVAIAHNCVWVTPEIKSHFESH